MVDHLFIDLHQYGIPKLIKNRQKIKQTNNQKMDDMLISMFINFG